MEKKRLEQHRMKPDGEKGRRGQIETVDPETGEVLKGVFAFIPDRYRSPFGKDFFVMAQEALAYLAQNRRHLGEEGLAVFCCLASRLDFENFILINQAEAARELGMLPPNFSRAVKRRNARNPQQRAEDGQERNVASQPAGRVEGHGQEALRGAARSPEARLEAHQRRGAGTGTGRAAARPVQRS